MLHSEIRFGSEPGNVVNTAGCLKNSTRSCFIGTTSSRRSWNEHFAWAGPELKAKSPIGRVTLYVLGINLPHRVAFRQLLTDEGVFPPAEA